MQNILSVQRILLALGVIVFVGAAVVSSTGAFFNDTETSTGNTFAAGEIDLLIDSQSHYAGLVCIDTTPDDQHNPTWQLENPAIPTTRPDLEGAPCGGTWEQTNLAPVGFDFFNFSDLKPGDNGENTLSLHVNSNDAYMCAVIGNMVDADNTCTEPESDPDTCNVGDSSDPANGDLSPELHFFAWADNGTGGGVKGDNIWNGDEPALFSNVGGPASDVLGGVVYPLFVPPNAPIAGNDTAYVGMYWCYGNITVGAHTLSCDGAPVTNISQTDSLTADIAFYAVQSRNNPNFTCGQDLLSLLDVE